MVDVFVMDAIYAILETEYVDTLDDGAFADAVQSQATYLAGLSVD